jgi:hypothetical protein
MILIQLKYTKHIASSCCDHPKPPIVPSAFVFAFLEPTLVPSLSFSCLLSCFVYCMYSCVLVDIVPVSSEQPVGADQEQVFEEEPQCLSKEGKWISPFAYFLTYITTCLHNVYFTCCYALN